MNGLGCFGAHLHAERAAGGSNREVAIAETTHEIEGLPRLLLHREPQRVLLDALLHRVPHVRRRLEEAIRRDDSLDALVRTMEVVPIDVEPESPLTVREVRKHRPRQKLFPQRLPKSLHLSERLRMLRSALHVPDAVPSELPLEVRLPAPGRVLPPLIRQHLLGRAVLRDAPREGLHHQLRPLMVGERVRHDEARVVVHEGRQVQPLLPPQQKRENVRLPELVRGRSLEAPRWMRPSWLLRRSLFEQPLLVEDPPDFSLADAERLEARQDIADPASPVLGVPLPERGHGCALHLQPLLPARWRVPRLRDQGLRSPCSERHHPLLHRRDVETKLPRHAPRARPSLRHHLDDAHSHRHRVRPPGTASSPGLTLRLLPLCHPSLHSGLPRPGRREGFC